MCIIKISVSFKKYKKKITDGIYVKNIKLIGGFDDIAKFTKLSLSAILLIEST